jgi:hypothetical protein
MALLDLEWLPYDPPFARPDWEEPMWHMMCEQATFSCRTRLYEPHNLRVYTAWYAGATPHDGIAFSLLVFERGEILAHEYERPLSTGGLQEAHNALVAEIQRSFVAWQADRSPR